MQELMATERQEAAEECPGEGLGASRRGATVDECTGKRMENRSGEKHSKASERLGHWGVGEKTTLLPNSMEPGSREKTPLMIFLPCRASKATMQTAQRGEPLLSSPVFGPQERAGHSKKCQGVLHLERKDQVFPFRLDLHLSVLRRASELQSERGRMDVEKNSFVRALMKWEAWQQVCRSQQTKGKVIRNRRKKIHIQTGNRTFSIVMH
ncbi:UNVERIFIED_CONTAM: hypothetical protein K2H54_062230 [Gekko kuhli]